MIPHRVLPDARHRAESEGHNRPRSNTLPKSFGSTLEQDTAAEGKGHRPTREETLELVQWRLRGRKQDEGWPDDIKVGAGFRWGGRMLGWRSRRKV